jgi:hypothetical protein
VSALNSARQRVPSSPDALLGVVRNLPGGVAGAALHPPIVAARAVFDLQDGLEKNVIGRVPVLALSRATEGGRVKGAEPSTTVGGLHVDRWVFSETP